MSILPYRSILLGIIAAAGIIARPLLADPAAAQPAEPFGVNDIPNEFTAEPPDKGYSTRVEMISMRDGVDLQTVIVIPEDVHDAPILLSRTPYDAMGMTASAGRDRLLQRGFIRVYQDVRGKFGSEGSYVVTQPPRGPLNPTSVDHSTDAWDTIDWLVKHVPESNGRVGMIGSSYNGFTTAMALLDPHPALKAAVPQGPLIDAWMGDDWFHYGAFRNLMLGYIHMQTAQKGQGTVPPSDIYDKYEEFLRAGSTGDYIRSRGLDKLPWIARTMAHPAYDDYWQGQALDRLLAARPSSVPTLWTQGLWDQEDMYGANHAWLALKEAGHKANNWLVLGPWNHIQVNTEGYSLGPMRWQADTAAQYHNEILVPFLNEHLCQEGTADLSRVTVYNTGESRWEHLDDWPTACRAGCEKQSTPLYLRSGFRLSFERPTTSDGGDSYTSDPAKPIPFLPRPVVDPFRDLGTGSLGNSYKPWSTWLVHDQRFIASRPDVLVYETPVLTSPVHVRGVPLADIYASTTGSDGDFVVKLIDAYPADYPTVPELGGYQLPIAMDIFRGRYRESFTDPSAIPSDVPQRYQFDLPNVNHVFQRGHRIVVHIQSTLFPLYDRNPQTFVPNIFNAESDDYRKAEITIFRSEGQATAIWLPVVGQAE